MHLASMDESPKTGMTPEALSALALKLSGGADVSKAMPAALEEAIDKKKKDDDDDDDTKDAKDSKDVKKTEKSITLTEGELQSIVEKAVVLGLQAASHGVNERLAPLEKAMSVITDNTSAIMEFSGASFEIFQGYKTATDKQVEVSKSQSLYLASLAKDVSDIGNAPVGRRSVVDKSVELVETFDARANLSKIMKLNKAAGLDVEGSTLRTSMAMRGDFSEFNAQELLELGVK